MTALDRLTAGVLIAASVGAPALLALLDARTELARLGQDALRYMSGRSGGLARHERTRRLEAAHTVVVVTAYFEALAETDLPVRVADLELTASEQIALAGGDAGLTERRDFVALIQSAGAILPESQWSHTTVLEALERRYAGLSESLEKFVSGLALWERMTAADRDRFGAELAAVPARACVRYEELLRQLAAEFPEVALWVNLREHQAAQAGIRELSTALAGLERVLAGISTGAAPDARRLDLARAYRAALDRPVVASGDVPDGLRLPLLGDGYLTPRFRVGRVSRAAQISDESWWQNLPVRDDFQEFLAGYLTSGQATQAPLLVLGQPGSGKSLMTQVLAARLPATEFLPVRVALREVPSTAGLQDQIEHAIRGATGERLDWPALARSAGDAVPVIFLDGFDELLQATGVSQTDYLAKVVEFQRREDDQGRSVVVVVTTRTSVADRAQAPESAVAVRLEPFDADQVRAWLDIWNAVNVDYFRATGLRPLAARTVLGHGGLAEQPLLLLMLALYDADGNALQDGAAGLRENDLYERLLRSFARREVVKHQPGLSDRDRAIAVEQELRRLSIVAFAMFNRGTQWVAESDLESDLAALFRAPGTVAAQGFRPPLRAAELIIGRFFFVHRAQALRDDTRLETYEFLHATFGEFLAARLIWQVLRDIAAREAASTVLLSGTPVSDDLLHALLSFVPLSVRAPIMGFLVEMADRLDAADRDGLTALLIRLFHAVHLPRGGRMFDAYLPRPAPPAQRYAAYSANLVLLILCTAGQITASQLFAPGSAVGSWKCEVVLWRSQLADGWLSMVDCVRVDRVWNGDQRDLRLVLTEEPWDPAAIDLYWSFDVPAQSVSRGTAWVYSDQHASRLQRRANFLCRTGEDVAQNALEPLAAAIPSAIGTIEGWDGQVAHSVAHVLLAAWTLPARNPSEEERHATYMRCSDIATARFPPWQPGEAEAYAKLLLRSLSTDHDAAPSLVDEILARIQRQRDLVPAVAPELIRCAAAFLGRETNIDTRLMDRIRATVAAVEPSSLPADVQRRLATLGLT